jgi:hypothetical protein
LRALRSDLIEPIIAATNVSSMRKAAVLEK